MNVLARRAVRRVGVGAAALIAAGALAGVASPAYAIDPTSDLGVQLAGETIGPGSAGKAFLAKVTNFGPDEAAGVTVEFDLSELLDEKVTAAPVPGCVAETDKILCTSELALPKDGTEEFPILLTPVAGQTGDAGKLTARVSDSVEADGEHSDSATVSVTIGNSGADLIAVALDVYSLSEGGERSPVAPGGVAPLLNFTVNQGDRTVSEWQSVTQLPEHVTFVEHFDNCGYSEDNRTETCLFTDALEPATGVDLTVDVKVSADAPGPVSLTGGNLTVQVRAEVEGPTTNSANRTAVGERLAVLDEKLLDNVDSTDNSDDFAVFVGPKPAGGGGPGTLPITGVQVGVIGVVGVAVVALGGMLLLLSRRRRVVAVAPEDGSAED